MNKIPRLKKSKVKKFVVVLSAIYFPFMKTPIKVTVTLNKSFSLQCFFITALKDNSRGVISNRNSKHDRGSAGSNPGNVWQKHLTQLSFIGLSDPFLKTVGQ